MTPSLTMLRSWGVPTAEAKLVLEGPVADTEAMTFAREFVQHRTTSDALPMLVLAGPIGVGKTVAACYVMVHANPLPPDGRFQHDQRPLFRHVSEIVEIGSYDKTHKEARAEFRTARCLVIDDLGEEYQSDPFVAMLDALINHRYGHAGSTVITTNLTDATFRQRYGERAFDRIRHRGAWYDINHASLRGSR